MEISPVTVDDYKFINSIFRLLTSAQTNRLGLYFF